MKFSFFPRAAFLQFQIQPGDLQANLATVKQLIAKLDPEDGTVLMLPELWSSGFDYPGIVDHARHTPSILADIMEIAGSRNIVIAGSLPEAGEGEPDLLYNTLFVTGPKGVVGKFQKQHLFTYWQEEKYFQPGNYCRPVQTSWGMVGGLVCYDVRFPEIARDQVSNGADLLLVSAQWPAARLDHWRSLLQARAIENQVFVVACNACGRTGETEMAGHSMILAPDGTILVEAGKEQDVFCADLDGGIMGLVRGRFSTAGERPRAIRDETKIVSLDQLLPRISAIRKQGGKIAFTNGCFDILHSGHAAYLEKARQTSDCLIVGLNSDKSVRSIKGTGRPVNSEMERARVLAGLGCVDFVVLFGEDTPQRLIRDILPDVLVKGADWQEENIVGAPEVKSAGGKVVRIPFEHAVSTTEVISRVMNTARKNNC